MDAQRDWSAEMDEAKRFLRAGWRRRRWYQFWRWWEKQPRGPVRFFIGYFESDFRP